MAEYEEALKSYETGLGANPENKALNFNAAQAAYLLGEYEKAAQYYEKSEDSTDRFLNAGNASFRLGEAASDANQKAQYYAQALQTYQEGIIKYPQDVPLKYNYELVKQRIEELLENMEQESDGQSEDGDDGRDNDSQENQDQSSQNPDESGDEQSQTQESQDEDSEQSENSEQSEDSEQGENSEQVEKSEQNENSGEVSNEGQEGDDEQEGSYSQNEGEYDPDQEAIERILEMLEGQEEESLKNNQGVVGGKDEKNGW